MHIENTSLKFLRLLTKTGLFLFSILAVSGLSAASARANLAPDNSFHPPGFTRSTISGAALLLAEGKYFLFANPDTLTDQTTGALTRYLADGTLDTSFAFSRDYKNVTAVTPSGDGKFYVAATRYVYGVKEGDFILRLNADGSIDSTFTSSVAGSYPNEIVRQLLAQPDGKIIVVGFFGSFNGDSSQHSAVRLLNDGSVDSGFGAAPNGDVFGVALQTDGKIVIAGDMQSVNNGTSQVQVLGGVARLNPNGSVDGSFVGTGFTRLTANRAIAIQPDGMILLAGNFRIGSGGGARRMPIVRLTATGAFDTGFDASGLNAITYLGRAIVLQPDGKIVAAMSAASNNSVYRFNTNGSVDTGFHQPAFWDARSSTNAPVGTPATVNLSASGDILVGGVFTDVDPAGAAGYSHFGVGRLSSAGSVDSTLVSSHRTGREVAPSAFVRLDDGSTLVTFTDQTEPAIPYNLGRLLSDGSLDPTFTLSSSDPNRFLNGFSARGIEPLPDGDFFVYGVNTNGAPAYGKVHPDGSEDTTFTINQGIGGPQATIAPDGKIVMAAGTDAQLTLSFSVLRLLANGQFDNSFGGPIPGQVVRDQNGMLYEIYVGSRVLAIQADGKVLFQYFTQDKRFHLVRMNDGPSDGTFTETILTPTDLSLSSAVVVDPQSGGLVQPPGGVWSATPMLQDAHIQSDGRIILTGHFTSFGSTNARGIVRIEPNGTVDNTFNAGGSGMQWTTVTETATSFPTVENIEPTADGKFLITGNFEAFNGTAAPGIAQLNADGSLDTSFVAPVHRDKRSRLASACKAQPDGSFLLGGPYTVAGETTPRSLIRLVSVAPGAVNISTRLGVGTGENVLIEGFIVQGPAGSSKKILVRAIGPSLSQFGIADALANPTLEIHDGTGALVAANNDWKTTQVGGLVTSDQFGEINASGAAPGNDLESALIVPLAPGNYTAVVRGFGDTIGTGVVDAFDLDTGSAARLANIATRGLVQPGDQLMIAGFIVQNGAVKLVVRAIGPSLGAFGVSNALPDTTLQLRDQQGAIVLENDDWKSSQQQELESIGLQPSHDLEAALVATIQPGQYTAQVRGKGNASGIGVVQVYFLQ